MAFPTPSLAAPVTSVTLPSGATPGNSLALETNWTGSARLGKRHRDAGTKRDLDAWQPAGDDA